MSYSQEDRLCVSDLIWFSVYFCSGIEVSNGLSRFQIQSRPGPYVLLLFFLEGSGCFLSTQRSPPEPAGWPWADEVGWAPRDVGCYSPATVEEVGSAPRLQPYGCDWVAPGEWRNICLRMTHRRLGHKSPVTSPESILDVTVTPNFRVEQKWTDFWASVLPQESPQKLKHCNIWWTSFSEWHWINCHFLMCWSGVAPVSHVPVGRFSHLHLSEPANSGCIEEHARFSCGTSISYSGNLTMHFLYPSFIKMKDPFVSLLTGVCVTFPNWVSFKW